MKKTTFFFAFLFGAISISAQAFWNKKLPAASAINSFSELRNADGSYWVSSDRALFQIAETGEITGQLLGTTFWVWGSKIAPSPPAQPYYLFARVASLAKSDYTIAHHHPDLGVINQVAFEDTTGSITQTKGPVFVPVDDSTLLVFGRSIIREIRHRESGAIMEVWAKSMSLKTSDAVWTGSQAIFCDAFGHFKSIDASGNLLWEQTHPFTSKSIKLLPDGILGCGNAASGEGLVFKLSFNGNLLWSKLLAEPKLNDLTQTSDGGILLAGETDSMTLLILKTDGLGNTLWTRSYENGKGWDLEPTSDGGAVVLWFASAGFYRLHLSKIDALGNTVPVDNEPSPVYERTLYTSGAKSTQYPKEGLFFDGNSSRLVVPADGTASPIYTNAPWLAGHDLGGNLHIAATTYNNQIADYRAGIVSSPEKDFARVWAISREQITQIRRDFSEDGDLDTPPPFDLLSWPAKGNPNFRQNLDFSLVTTNPDSLPAPFVDHNWDGKYNVFDGDYPRLLGDRMLWWVRTDQTLHEETNGEPLGVDVFFTLYGYDCPLNGSISQSVFADYQFINRSGGDYSDAYMGFFTDFDLGCSDDDYIGSMPETNSVYVYNQDVVDGHPDSTCAAGTATYGETIPVESLTMLNQSLDFATYHNRTSFPSIPGTPIEYYYHLQGLVCNGQLPTIGGTGCNPGSVDYTNYIFPDNPIDPLGWSMCTENLAIGDRRMLSSHGPFTFAAGDTFNIQLVFTFHPNIPHPCPDITGLVKPTIQQIQQWHDDGTLNAHLDLGSVLTLTPGQSLLLNASQQNPATTYSWSSGQNTPSIEVNQTGEYTVTITPTSGCAYSETVLIKSTSSISNPTQPEWRLQPNPANDVLKIVFESAEMPITAVLRNAQGQLVATKNSSNSHLEISVVNLPTGLYWAELWQEGKFLGSRKVVVAR